MVWGSNIAPQRVWAERCRQTQFGAIHSPKFANLLSFTHVTYWNADSVHVVSSSSVSRHSQSAATKYISCIFGSQFFINSAVKSATLLAHAVFASISSSSRPSVYRVRQNKVTPFSFFLLFSQQPFGILIWNFTDLFYEIFYVWLPSEMWFCWKTTKL